MSRFARLSEKAQATESYWEEHLKFSYAVQLSDAMAEANISQKQFAERVGVSESQISQILSGSKNLSIRSLVKYASALNKNISISFESSLPNGKNIVAFNNIDSDSSLPVI